MCDLPPVCSRLVHPTNLTSRIDEKKTHTTHTEYQVYFIMEEVLIDDRTDIVCPYSSVCGGWLLITLTSHSRQGDAGALCRSTVFKEIIACHLGLESTLKLMYS